MKVLFAILVIFIGVNHLRLAHSSPRSTVEFSDESIICDGKHDNTLAMQRLFEHEIRAESLNLPAGTCLFHKPLILRLNRASVVGAGGAATILVYDGPDDGSDVISVRASYGSRLAHFGVWSRTRLSGGAALHVQQSSYITLTDMHINNYDTDKQTLWNALWIDQPNFVSGQNLYLQAQNDALRISARGVGTPYQYDVFITGSKISDSGTGLHIGGGIDNVHLDSTEVTSNNINILDDNALFNAVNQEIYIGAGVVVDQALENNVLIDDKMCNRHDYGFVNIGSVVTNAKHGSGILVRSFPDCELLISSPMIAKNHKHGVEIQDGTSHVVVGSGVIITDNQGYGIYSPSRLPSKLDAEFIGNERGASCCR